jgi:alpha-glucosidase
MIYGEGSWRIYHGEGDKPLQLEVKASGNVVELSGDLVELDELILLGSRYSEAEVDGVVRPGVSEAAGTRVEVGGTVRRIVLR